MSAERPWTDPVQGAGVSAVRATIIGVGAASERDQSGSESGAGAALHLVLGDDEYLIERAVAAVIADVRSRAGLGRGDDLAVNRMRAGDVTGPEIAELLSPSLFAEDRIVVLEAAAEAGKDAVALVLDAATDLPDGVVLVVLHSGAGRAKAMAAALEKVGAAVHPCGRLTKPQERIDFVRREFRSAGVRVSPEVVSSVVDAIGSDLRELAAACSQLAADTGGRVDVAAVHRYYSGRAEVTGFDVADLAVSGDRAGALEALRWAQHHGVAHVLLADALAEAVHTIARVGSAGRGDPFRMASELGMPPWKVKKAQSQARGWNQQSIGEALQVVAQLNAEVKGMAADPNYALERAVSVVASARSR